MLDEETAAEELEDRTEQFNRLMVGSLFNAYVGRQKFFFIAVKKINEETWQVINLVAANRELITAGQKPEQTTVTLNEMYNLNVHLR